jgi:hypothetical protein
MKHTRVPQKTVVPDSSVNDIVEQIFATRCIKRRDQQHFMNLVLSATAIAHQEHVLINRVLDAVQLGQLRIID